MFKFTDPGNRSPPPSLFLSAKMIPGTLSSYLLVPLLCFFFLTLFNLGVWHVGLRFDSDTPSSCPRHATLLNYLEICPACMALFNSRQPESWTGPL